MWFRTSSMFGRGALCYMIWFWTNHTTHCDMLLVSLMHYHATMWYNLFRRYNVVVCAEYVC